ncbi:MAG TPA: haloacid dehalogenase-like hydrolase [Polyangiaceae bacterium]|nr:haloacid dehalogenase-like hydrolase [Polyangiaceae bacterium]
MELWSAERVSERIEALASAHPGGVVATDGDGTLWSGDVGEDLFHAFLRHGRVEAPAVDAIRREARDHELSDAGTGPDVARRLYDAYLAGGFPEERICEVMTWCFAGWTRGEVREFARAVVEQGRLASRLHGEVLRVLERMRLRGIPVVVVSASPVDVVVEAAARVGFAEADVVAARPRFQGAVMLPEVERPIPYADGKVARLREHVGPARLVYAALGDNAFDVALLASARVGVAVRPKPRLRQRAHEVEGLVELSP